MVADYLIVLTECRRLVAGHRFPDRIWLLQ